VIRISALLRLAKPNHGLSGNKPRALKTPSRNKSPYPAPEAVVKKITE
jgi:hypothetical protein